MQLDKMREAMSVIAEVRDSERLRQFISSGQDRKSCVNIFCVKNTLIYCLQPERLLLPQDLTFLAD